MREQNREAPGLGESTQESDGVDRCVLCHCAGITGKKPIIVPIDRRRLPRNERGIGSDVRHAQTIEVLSVNLSDKKIMTSQGRGYERSTYGLEHLAPAFE
jgi:hypothetical protein